MSAERYVKKLDQALLDGTRKYGWRLGEAIRVADRNLGGKWPTPRAADSMGRSQWKSYEAARKGRYSMMLCSAVRPSIAKGFADRNLGGKDRMKSPTTQTGQLNPDWVEWLMGWPIGWTSLIPLNRLQWLDRDMDPFFRIPRVTERGGSLMGERLKAIGNGQVPSCAAAAAKMLCGDFGSIFFSLERSGFLFEEGVMDRSGIMSRIKGKDTAPELEIRKELRRLGFAGYRLQWGEYRIDVAFVGAKIAIFYDSCFWHGCRSHFRTPKTNAEFWESKIARNRKRDRTATSRLSKDGWLVLRLWEHDFMRKDFDLCTFLRNFGFYARIRRFRRSG